MLLPFDGAKLDDAEPFLVCRGSRNERAARHSRMCAKRHRSRLGPRGRMLRSRGRLEARRWPAGCGRPPRTQLTSEMAQDVSTGGGNKAQSNRWRAHKDLNLGPTADIDNTRPRRDS